MFYLLLSILCSVAIAHIFKWVEQKSFPIFPIFAINYAMATLVAWINGHPVYSSLTLGAGLLGIAVGILFISSFVVFMIAVTKLGVTIPVSLMRLSAVLPTLGSILIFQEQPDWQQITGLFLAFSILPLSQRQAITRHTLQTMIHEGLGWSLFLFIIFGVTDFSLKIQVEVFPIANASAFLTVVFATCFIIAAVMCLLQRQTIRIKYLGTGALLGIFNLLSTLFFLKALRVLPGMLVYPFNGIGIILLSALTSMMIWKERLVIRQWIFILLASVALILIR
jgi:drug/metabolite transporter (DMT)-like permease